jgi:hypothetical protein
LSEILGLLAGRSEVDLRDDFYFHTLAEANIAQMYDAYLAYAFDMERPDEERAMRLVLAALRDLGEP